VRLGHLLRLWPRVLQLLYLRGTCLCSNSPANWFVVLDSSRRLCTSSLIRLASSLISFLLHLHLLYSFYIAVYSSMFSCTKRVALCYVTLQHLPVLFFIASSAFYYQCCFSVLVLFFIAIDFLLATWQNFLGVYVLGLILLCY